MNLFRVRKTVRSLRRYREILQVFLKYGFEDVLDRLRIERLIRHSRKLLPQRKNRRLARTTRPERVRLMAEELGPTFIKFGQMLSTRFDLLPEEYILELRKLQDAVAPFPAESAKGIVEKEIGRPLEDVFSRFELAPLAAASIAQVHRAETRSGEAVVVKVQRPGIESMIRSDTDILLDLARLIERRIPESRLYGPVAMVQEFSRWIRQEQDFLQEGRNVDRFRRNFAGDASVYIPRVHWNITTARVLALEYVDGIPIQDLGAIERAGLKRKTIAKNGAAMVLKMVFEHGFFHGDPHPGNLFVLPGHVIAPLDFGLMGRLDEETVDWLAALASAVLNKDIDRVVRAFLSVGMVEEDVDARAIKADLSDLLERYYDSRFNQVSVEHLVNEVTALVSRHRIRLPRNMYLMGKAMAVIESVGLRLDPDFNLIPLAKPFILRFIRKRMNAHRLWRSVSRRVDDYKDFFDTLPEALRTILAKVRRGELNVNLQHRGLDHLIRELDKSTNRLSFSLIIAAVIIGSSLIILANLGPKLFGLSAFGLIGYLFAGILGLWLVIAIMRSGRL